MRSYATFESTAYNQVHFTIEQHIRCVPGPRQMPPLHQGCAAKSFENLPGRRSHVSQSGDAALQQNLGLANIWSNQCGQRQKPLQQSIPTVAIQQLRSTGRPHYRIQHQRNLSIIREKIRDVLDNGRRLQHSGFDRDRPHFTKNSLELKKNHRPWNGKDFQHRHRILCGDTGYDAGSMEAKRGEGLEIGLDARASAAVRTTNRQRHRQLSITHTHGGGVRCHFVDPTNHSFEIKCILAVDEGLFARIIPCMRKEQVAQIFNEIGTLLELKGENPFKSRAYVNAARTLESLSEPIETLVIEQRLGQIKGIGEALQKKIEEMVTTGRLEYYESLKASIPAGLFQLLTIPGLGPKKVKVLYDQLGIQSMDELEAACKEGKVAALAGFGEKTQVKICQGIQFRRAYASQHLVADALAASDPILESLRAHPEVSRCSTAGSLRRFKEIIGDIDFLVSTKNPLPVLEFFRTLPQVESVQAHGDTKASVILQGGMQADLRVVADHEFPFALAYFTGSKEHNIVMRQRAIQRGLRLNEYGLFKSEIETRDPALLVSCRTEEEIFQALDLPYIPPELREDQGEFNLVGNTALPRLLEWTDLRGSLHNHSNWSDGKCSLQEIADAMLELGLEYWAITDHSKSSVQANGLSPERLRQQCLEIRALNHRFTDRGLDFRFLTGSEVDILSDGQLDFDDDVLGDLDVVVASIHQGFTRGEAETTRRLIRAAENPHVHILGHLTGRLLLEREPYAVNQQAVIDACAETGTWIELNSSPHRFDLDWRQWRYATSKGIKCVINCDAHRNEHAGFLRLGAGIARKGWLTRHDVINTLPLENLVNELKGKRARLREARNLD